VIRGRDVGASRALGAYVSDLWRRPLVRSLFPHLPSATVLRVPAYLAPSSEAPTPCPFASLALLGGADDAPWVLGVGCDEGASGDWFSQRWRCVLVEALDSSPRVGAADIYLHRAGVLGSCGPEHDAVISARLLSDAGLPPSASLHVPGETLADELGATLSTVFALLKRPHRPPCAAIWSSN
jgi:hypothetical protein